MTDRIREVADRWRSTHAGACAFGSDREGVETVHAESDSIVEAALAIVEHDDAPDLSDFGQRELVQLVVSRAQHMAEIGMTPAAAAAFVPTLAEACGQGFPNRFVGLQHVVIETYARAVAERASARAQEIFAEHTPVVRLAPGIVAAFLMGDPEPERVARIVERLEQVGLEAGAKVLIVDLSHLQVDEPDRLRAALAADVGARMLGARLLITGVDARVRSALERVGISLDQLELLGSIEEALDAVRRKGLFARLFDS